MALRFDFLSAAPIQQMNGKADLSDTSASLPATPIALVNVFHKASPGTSEMDA